MNEFRCIFLEGIGMLTKNINSLFEESISVKNLCLSQGLECLASIGNEISKSLKNKGKLLSCQ